MQDEQIVDNEEWIPNKDIIVMDLSTWANRNIFVNATLSVKGVLYSGVVIGGKEWCSRNIELYQKSAISDDSKEGITVYFERLINNIYNDENIKNSNNPDYIHMAVTSISGQNRRIEEETLWRFRISEVDGVFLGGLNLI